MAVSRRPARQRRRSARRSSAGRWVVLLMVGALLFAAGLYLGDGGFLDGAADPPSETSRPPAPPAGAERAGPTPAADERRPYPAATPASSEPETSPPSAGPFSLPPPVEGPPPPGDGAVVALVIDDLGRSVEDLARLARLEVPVTYAVLPFESRTAEVVDELRRRNEELILHLPMEPSNGADPGPGALRSSMSRRELARATRAALDAVPGAVGVNNHMGSGLSADRRAMEAVLREIGRRGLYFLDSRTSAESVGYHAARAQEIPAAERQVFLDPDPRADAVRFQFRRLLEVARERGAAIAIGHPHDATLRILEEEVPLARERGYRFVPVSYLVDRSAVAAR